jgi:hypothetical protein
MRKTAMLVFISLFIAGWCCAGCCRADDGDGVSGSGNDEELSSEIESQKAEGEEELNEMDFQTDANSTSQTAVDQVMDI